MINLPTRKPDCDSHGLALLDLFLYSTLFYWIADELSREDLDGICHHLRDVPWEDIFKLKASAGVY